MLRLPRNRRLYGAGKVLLLTLVSHVCLAADQGQTERRLHIGLRLFPSFVAADEELANKRMVDGRLQLLLLYKNDAAMAERAARRLRGVRQIRDFPLRISVLPYERLPELRDKPPSALFLAEWSPDDRANVVRFAIKHRRIVFSPFRGDVRHGIMAGVSVTDLIVPLVNTQTVRAAAVHLKPFFLEVSNTVGQRLPK